MSWNQVWQTLKDLLAEVVGYAKTMLEKAVQALANALELAADVFWAELAKAIAKLAQA